jgi:uncharacterized membrane protein
MNPFCRFLFPGPGIQITRSRNAWLIYSIVRSSRMIDDNLLHGNSILRSDFVSSDIIALFGYIGHFFGGAAATGKLALWSIHRVLAFGGGIRKVC